MDEISAVVCVKNGAGTLESCLGSIRKNDPCEIIVIDDHSTDGTVDIARRYTDRIYPNDGTGLAHARQMGAEKARGRYVFYLDADGEIPGEGTLRAMLSELRERQWVAIQAITIVPGEHPTYWEQGENFFWAFKINRVGEKSILSTGNCLIERDILMKYRFDPFFQGAVEDTDLFYRIHEAGHRFGTSPEVVYHHHKADFRSFLRQKVWFGRGNARFFWKYRRSRVLLMPVFLIVEPGWNCLKRGRPGLIFYFLLWSLAHTYGFLGELIVLYREPRTGPGTRS